MAVQSRKLFLSAQEAVADIPDGATIMIGGFSHSGIPRSLLTALRDQGAKELTIILNGSGTERFIDGNFLVRGGQVKRVLCSLVQPGTAMEKAEKAGQIQVDLIPQGTLVERIRAGGCGIGGFYTPTGVGTEIEIGKEKRNIGGREYVLEFPLRADYALVHAYKADTFGNLVYRGIMGSFNAIMAMAAEVTIAEVGDIVEPGELDPNTVGTPQIFVDRIVKAPPERLE